jgi:MFS family permease
MDDPEAGQRPAFGRQMRPAALIIFIIFLNLFSRSLFSPLLLEIEAEFGIRHAAASRFFLIISLGYGFSLLFSGYVSAVLQHKGTMVLSITMMGCASPRSGFSWSSSSWRWVECRGSTP